MKGLLRVREDLAALVRMRRAYKANAYRAFPWRTSLSAVAAILYFIVPFDLIPDFIFGLGILDDGAMFYLVARMLRSDLERFRQWEQSRAP